MISSTARLFRWLRSLDGIAYLALLALAFVVRVIIAPKLIISADLLAYSYWGQLFDAHPLTFYSAGGANPNWTLIPNYPPVAIYLFGALEKVYFSLGALLGIPLSHDVLAAHMLKLVLKLPGILADLALLSILYVKAIRLMPRWLAWLLSATYALSPGILITVVVWGQTDGIALLLVAVGLLLAARKQDIWCGIVLACAVSFKPQPIVFVPLALIYLIRWSGVRNAVRGAVAFIATTFVIWLPYLLPPNFEVLALKRNFSVVAANEFPTASHSGWNLWYVLGIEAQNASAPFLGPLSITMVGGLLFAVILLIVLVGIWRDGSEGRLWAGAAIVGLAFFVVGTLQYERYLFPALGLFFLAALYNRRYWLIYAVTSLVYMANFGWTIFGCKCDLYTPTWPPIVQQMLTFHLDGWQGGLINCIALVVSVTFFVWPEAERAGQAHPVFQPGFGLAQPDEQLALAPAFATAGAPYSAASTRPVVQRHGVMASTAAMTDTLPATLRVRAVTPPQASAQTQASTAPKLRLRPRTLGRPPYVSIVIPCYNEQGNIWPMYERLTAALSRVTPTYELIFVNNGSYDGSPELFEELAARDPKVSVLTLSRNFGSQGAYTAGFAYASGDCVVGLDGDIQDPPELIPALVEQWLLGYDVVYGVRARRKGSLPRRIGYKLFYRLLHKVSYVDIPHDASDFGLMDRRVVNVLNEMPERSRLIRGLRAFAGFSQTGIPYTRDERHSGFTSNSFFGLFRWASLGIISFSFAPLDLISYLAGGVVALAGVGMLVYTALYFIFPGAPHGFQTLLLVVLFLGAVQLLCLSIIGAYLGKIFEEVKARPRFLVNDIQNDHRAGG